MANAQSKMIATLTDEDVPLNHRKQLLAHMCMDDSEQSMASLQVVMQRLAGAQDAAAYKEKLEELENGPLRPGTYVSDAKPKNTVKRAWVSLEDGTRAVVPVPDDPLMDALVCGDAVLLEAQGKALLFADGGVPETGEEARFERKLGEARVEVTARGDERHVYLCAHALAGRIEAGEVEAGATLLVCPHRKMAFEALPDDDGLSHYRFLVRDPVPNVVAERDLGTPPDYIEELLGIVRLELEQPGLRRSWGLRRCVSRLLAGVSGSGKTYSIMAFWRGVYELMSEVTGVPLDQLPPRVMRLRASQVISKWYGETDKNIDRFFNEAEQLAGEVFVAPDGREHELPVLVLIEEIDGIGRNRGDEPLYDRMLTTVLQRMDNTVESLQNKLILFLASSNVAHLVDPALLRRIGGRVEKFGRLTRPAFSAVLDKQLTGRALENPGGADEDEARRRLVAEVAGWLYGPDAPQLVELTLAGSTTRTPKQARDFLTAAHVDMAVERASTMACRQQADGNLDAALDRAALIGAIESQVRTVVDQLHESTVDQYLDLPDGVRVATLHRCAQPAMQPYDIERVA